jgi:glycerol-3-phosphate dehydrogenase (NAD(P)+)
MKVIIIGSGNWGKTLGYLLKINNHEVDFYSARNYQLSELFASKINEDNLIISAVSMAGVRPTVNQLVNLSLPKNLVLVTATKGLDSATTNTASQIWQEALPSIPLVVLSGPNLSVEISQGLPAASVAASGDRAAAKMVQQMFSSPKFRVYTNDDPLGVELGGTLKNVMAIASGACDGLQLGTNAKAALLTRGLAEMIRIGTDWGAQAETFYGLSGLGDLLATCNSSLSRNYQVGYGLAQGKTLPEILQEIGSTAEGVNTTSVLVQRGENKGIYLPISFQVQKLLNNEISPKAAVAALMLRDTKPE